MAFESAPPCGRITSLQGEVKMMACNFVWPPNYLSHESQTRVAAELCQHIDQIGFMPALCHGGAAEIHVAYTMPMRGNVDAVLTCSCGQPYATIRGTRHETETSWQITQTIAAR